MSARDQVHAVERRALRSVSGTGLPRVAPSMEEVQLACHGLPPVLRSLAEVEYFLGLKPEFVRDYMSGPVGETPAMPSVYAGKRVFPTGLVMRWLMMWFPGDGHVEKRGGAASSKHQVPSTKEAPVS